MEDYLSGNFKISYEGSQHITQINQSQALMSKMKNEPGNILPWLEYIVL